MRIAFARTGESHDRIYVTRDDGSELAWRWPAGGPPHDLLHLGVEQELGLELGFWGIVASGAELTFVDSHSRHDDAFELSDAHRDGLNQAEAIVGAVTLALTVDGVSDAEALEHGRSFARRMDAELPVDDEASFRRVVAAAEAMRARWEAMPVGETLVVEY